MIWDAIRYGFSTHYWLTIAGVPVVWGEAATGLGLPSGFGTEDGSLVIDSSAAFGTEQINREIGISVGLGLSFKLLDSATSTDWLRTWSKSMTLTADQIATATAATVDDSTGWNNGDTMFLAMENQTIGTVASGTSLTGITRAVAESLAYDHDTGTTAQIITDRPRFWRGRQVVLWASPVDPSGFVTGATLATDAVQVWKGKLSGSPRREPDGFAFEAVSLDRILAQPLVGEVTGVISDASSKHEVKQGWSFTLAIDAINSTGASLWSDGYELAGQPFKADTDGDMLAPSLIKERIAAEFAVAVTAATAGADLGDLVWAGSGADESARVEVVADVNIVRVDVSLTTDNNSVPIITERNYVGGMPASPNGFVDTGWLGGSSPLFPQYGGVTPDESDSTITSLTIRLDEGAPSDVTAPGIVQIDKERFTFSVASSSEGNLYLGGMQRIGLGSLTGQTAIKKTAAVLFEDSGTADGMMLRCLMTSGTTGNQRSATYDTLVRGQGYGLDEDEIHEASFTGGGAPITSMPLRVSHAAKSFADIFGGMLGMFRRAVVSRPDLDDSHNIKLTLVRTITYGSTYAATITDDDLLSAATDPIQSVEPAEVANSITILRQTPGEDADASDRFVFNDLSSADIIGKVEASYSVPTKERDTLLDLAKIVVPSRLAADQTLQAVSMLVGPWIAAYPGDVVLISAVTHPALWTWTTSPGSVGHTGNGLVVGRTMDPVSTAVTLTVLLGGQLDVGSLSPAMLVSAHTGQDTDPATIDVPLGLNDGYLTHMVQAIDLNGGPVELYHYVPGDAEGAAESYTCSAATKTGGVCRLTIDTTTGGHTLVDNSSTLTLPTTNGGDITTYQGNFAHVDDGTNWG